jgi:hypothetical protein
LNNCDVNDNSYPSPSSSPFSNAKKHTVRYPAVTGTAKFRFGTTNQINSRMGLAQQVRRDAGSVGTGSVGTDRRMHYRLGHCGGFRSLLIGMQRQGEAHATHFTGSAVIIDRRCVKRSQSFAAARG